MDLPIAHSEMQLYAKCMEEIKRRLFALNEIVTGAKTTSFEYTNAEFATLQVRKSLELVVLASVASNKAVMGSLFKMATDTWRIRRIVDIVAKANPNFYPQPVANIPTPGGPAPMKWIVRPGNWLTVDELISSYDDLGQFLHANSPYHPEPDVDKIMQNCLETTDKTVSLLSEHIVQMPGSKYLLNVQMNSSGDGKNPNGSVSCTIWEACT
jgi:hypothetical protein